ncbi:MAG: hypothetical protein V3V64_00525, partial [Acidiferrobacterales bacterium]
YLHLGAALQLPRALPLTSDVVSMSYDELRFWIVYLKSTLKKARLPFLSTGRFDGVGAAALPKNWSMR